MKIKFKRPKVWFSRKASKELRSLKPVLKKLSKVHELYTNAERGDERSSDISYWYSERPQVGLFAAAVYLSGKTAIEEYACRKGDGRQAKERCRGDLYIRESKATAFECEAKHLSANLRNGAAELVKRVQERLGKAATEAKLLKEADHHLGLCFLTPWISEPGLDRLDEGCDQVFDGLKSVNGRSRCDALVWIHCRTPIEVRKTNRCYPGLLLAIKEA